MWRTIIEVYLYYYLHTLYYVTYYVYVLRTMIRINDIRVFFYYKCKDYPRLCHSTLYSVRFLTSFRQFSFTDNKYNVFSRKTICSETNTFLFLLKLLEMCPNALSFWFKYGKKRTRKNSIFRHVLLPAIHDFIL